MTVSITSTPVAITYSLTLWMVMGWLDWWWRQRRKKDDDAPAAMFWVALAGAVISLGAKYIAPMFRKRSYTSGGYALGEIYRRMVLREWIDTRDDRVVGDQAVYMAQHIFTAGFGVVCGAAPHYDLIYKGDFIGYLKEVQKGAPRYTPSLAAFARATALARVYFKNMNDPVPVSAYWNLANFGTRALTGPIPDPNEPDKLMNVELPGPVFVKDGWPVEVSDPATADAVRANETNEEHTAGGMSWIAIAAAAAGGYFLLKKSSK